MLPNPRLQRPALRAAAEPRAVTRQWRSLSNTRPLTAYSNWSWTAPTTPATGTIGLTGSAPHTHGDILTSEYGGTPESAVRAYVDDVLASRRVIVISRVNGKLREAWITDDPARDEMRYAEPGETIEKRFWNGREVVSRSGKKTGQRMTFGRSVCSRLSHPFRGERAVPSLIVHAIVRSARSTLQGIIAEDDEVGALTYLDRADLSPELPAESNGSGEQTDASRNSVRA